MWYVIAFYWLVTGFSMWMLPDDNNSRKYPITIFAISLIFGGIIMPARFIAKLSQ